MSISFDRAADYYDATRALPEELATRAFATLAEELGPRQPVLEIGVGTGRIALPLTERGIDVVGIDISVPMLAKLVERRTGAKPRVAIADANLLPFADGSFAGALAVHVFHLIPTWRDVAAELVRVLQPGGTLVLDSGGWGDPRGVLMGRFLKAGGVSGPTHTGVNTVDEIDETMQALGATPRRLTPVTYEGEISWRAIVQAFEAGLYSPTWPMSDEDRARAARATEAWAEETYGRDLVPDRWSIEYAAYDI
jgi:SAM-dependent methyltransferase